MRRIYERKERADMRKDWEIAKLKEVERERERLAGLNGEDGEGVDGGRGRKSLHMRRSRTPNGARASGSGSVLEGARVESNGDGSASGSGNDGRKGGSRISVFRRSGGDMSEKSLV